jgi:CheY-like chemotaxis protein
VAQEFQPDFLLLDLGLPGIDGYELARRLRAGGFERTPIVAISGYAQENDRIRSREAGFNYHFAKPVDFEALAELILEDPIEE